MKKKIILFQPKFWPGPLENERPRSKKYYTGLRETFKYLPWSLLSVASALKEHYEVRLIDERFEKDWPKIVSDLISGGDVLFAGVTACTGYDIKGGLEFSKTIRKLDESVPIVWGGWHASTVPEVTIASDLVDIVVRGQGEWTAMELAERLQQGSRDLAGIMGLTYKAADGSIVNEADRPLKTAAEMPETDFSFVDVNNYLRFKDGSNSRLFYVSSLGCPFNCTFCSVASVYKRHFSSKAPERVIREIKFFVDNYGVQSVEFDGTIFFVNKQWTKDVLRGMIENDLSLQCITTTRADLLLKMDQETKDLVKDVGFVAIGVGAESGSERILKMIDKKIHIDDVIKSIDVLKEIGVDPCYTFMFGLPGETFADSLKTIELMVRLKKVSPECRTAGLFYHPFPGSQMYEQYKALHGLPDLSLEEWGEYSFDLKYTESLALDEGYIDFFKKRLQYFEWAYPEDDSWRGIMRTVLLKMARIRVLNNFYAFPIEWKLSRLVGKSSS